MVGAGVVIAAAGVVGQVTSDGDDAATGVASQSTSTTTTTDASSTTTTAAPTTTTVPPAAAFVPELVAAIRAGDNDFKYARLHPAVIDRYGEAICRAGLSPAQPDFVMDVVSVGPPEAWDWVTDGVTTTIPDTIPVTVRRIGDDGTTLVEAVIHLADVEGEIRWFTDCGDLP